MSASYSNINFVSPNDLGYKKWCRRHARITRLSQRSGKKDPFNLAFNKSLIEWEGVVQRLLSTLVPEYKNRILQYNEKGDATRYREIDFFTKLSKDKIVLFEIKLKQTFKEKLSASSSGWKQLNKSLDIASCKYKNIAGLAICIDMSYLYGLESIATDDAYCKYSDIRKYFDIAFIEKNVIWLNSLEIARLAVKNNFITNKDVDSLKKIFNEKNDPLSILKDEGGQHNNKPLEILLKK